MRQAAAATALAALLACGGGGGGTSPTGGSAATPAAAAPPATGWPSGTTVQLVDGATGQPLPGSFTVGGTTAQAGTPLASASANGTTVDVVLPGFLPRQTLVRTGETRLVLWPDTASLPADYTRSLVYTVTGTGGSETLSLMRRLPTRVRSVAVVPSPDILADALAMDAHRAAVDAINSATAPLGLAFVLGGSADFTVPATVDPTASTCSNRTTRAFASVWLSSSNEISRAEVTYCGGAIAATPGTVAHELGHTLGLRHSPSSSDLMYGFSGSTRATAPTASEALAFGLMRARRSGTEWPDNDRGTTAAAAARFEIVVD